MALIYEGDRIPLGDIGHMPNILRTHAIKELVEDLPLLV